MTVDEVLKDAGIIAAIVFGLAGLVFSFLNYRSQEKTKDTANRALVAAEKFAQHARLDFELRGSDELFLFTRNLGQAEAREVTVRGAADSGHYLEVVTFPSVQPSAEKGLLIDQHGFQIVAGRARWDLEVDWEDDAGPHKGVRFLATRHTSQS